MGLEPNRFRVHANGTDFRIFDAKYAKAVKETVPNDVRPAIFHTFDLANEVVSHLNARSYPYRPSKEEYFNDVFCRVKWLGRSFLVEGEYELGGFLFERVRTMLQQAEDE
jgi:hypothetical protein